MNAIEAVLWLAVTVFFEARGEPIAGQIAVAQVVLERVESSRWPDTIAGCVTQRLQFEGVNGKNVYLLASDAEAIDRKSFNLSLQIALFSLLARPLLKSSYSGVQHYWAPLERLKRGLPATPYWADVECQRRIVIGYHVFCGIKNNN